MPRISTVNAPLLDELEELELLELLDELEELELLEPLEVPELLEELELFEELELLVELELAPGSGSLREPPPPLEHAPSNKMEISITVWLIKDKDDLGTRILYTLLRTLTSVSPSVSIVD